MNRRASPLALINGHQIDHCVKQQFFLTAKTQGNQPADQVKENPAGSGRCCVDWRAGLAEAAMWPGLIGGRGCQAGGSIAIAWLTPSAKWPPSTAKMRVFLGN
jgi:hypothetical protein